MKKVILLVTLSIVFVVLYQMFSVQNKDKHIGKEETKEYILNDTLYMGIVNFDILDPIKSNNIYVQQLSKLVYNSLFLISEKFKPEKDLVDEMYKLDDLTYIIKLKSNVLWHDNTLLVANDILYTIDKIKMDSKSIYYKNVENIKSTKIIDEYTIKLELSKIDNFLEYNLIFPIIKNDVTVGTGAYSIKELEEKIILSSETLYLKKIEFKKYKDLGEMYIAFKNGELDLISTKNDMYNELLGDIGFNKKEYRGREYTYLKINLDRVKENEIREMLYYAINKKEIISKVYENTHYQAEFPLDTNSWLYVDSVQHKYDIEKSIQILESAGWKYKNASWEKSGSKLNLNILVDSMDETKNEILYIIKNQLSKIGIGFNINKVSTKLYESYVDSDKYDIILKNNNLSIIPKLGEYFGKDIEISSDMQDIRELIKFYSNLESKYISELPFIMLSCNKETLIYSDKIYGSITPNWYNIFYNIDTWKKIEKST